MNAVPPAVTVAPGVAPAAASAWAEKLDPAPSMFPIVGLVSSVTPTLSNAAARAGAGRLDRAGGLHRLGLRADGEHGGRRQPPQGEVAVAGTVTVHACDTLAPGAMFPTVAPPAGATWKPLPALRYSVAPVNGVAHPSVRVVVTVSAAPASPADPDGDTASFAPEQAAVVPGTTVTVAGRLAR